MTEADAAFQKKEYARARELYRLAREQIRDAQRRDASRVEWLNVTTKIVRCSTALSDAESATEEYFLLCRLDPQTPLDRIPLPWFTSDAPSASRPREQSAEEWLDPLKRASQSPSATLLAAAILSVSFDNGKRQRGLQRLRDLAATLDSDEGSPTTEHQKQVALLAGALLWKQRIPMLRHASDLAPLQRYLDRIPEPLRSGPLFLYGRAARQVGDLENAVLAWMRIPILDPENRVLAVESLKEAAAALEKLGRVDQAETLRREATGQ